MTAENNGIITTRCSPKIIDRISDITLTVREKNIHSLLGFGGFVFKKRLILSVGKIINISLSFAYAVPVNKLTLSPQPAAASILIQTKKPKQLKYT